MAKKKSSASRPGKTDESNVDFESSLAEVERIVVRLEGGELGLTESLTQYQSGIQHLKRCHQLLDAAQQRVSLLSGFDADGNPVTEPMSEFEARSNEKGSPKGSRARSRTTPNASQGRIDAVSADPRDQDSVDDEPGLF